MNNSELTERTIQVEPTLSGVGIVDAVHFCRATCTSPCGALRTPSSPFERREPRAQRELATKLIRELSLNTHVVLQLESLVNSARGELATLIGLCPGIKHARFSSWRQENNLTDAT